jgi:hypothetical protein
MYNNDIVTEAILILEINNLTNDFRKNECTPENFSSEYQFNKNYCTNNESSNEFNSNVNINIESFNCFLLRSNLLGTTK